MKKLFAKILTVSAFCLLVFGCKKNDGSGKLNIVLKSVNGTVFSSFGTITFDFNINHPSSETTNDTLYIRRKFITCPDSDGLDSIAVPEYTSTANFATTYELSFQYGTNITYASQCNTGARTDSLYYTFWLKDKNGNKSDSITSPKIIIKK